MPYAYTAVAAVVGFVGLYAAVALLVVAVDLYVDRRISGLHAVELIAASAALTFVSVAALASGAP